MVSPSPIAYIYTHTHSFEQDGFTHATAVPSRLVETANHFYQQSEGEWVCLRFRRSVLRSKFGIVTRDEEAMPVGDTAVGASFAQWVCPHVVGGLPPAAVSVRRQLSIEGIPF